MPPSIVISCLMPAFFFFTKLQQFGIERTCWYAATFVIGVVHARIYVSLSFSSRSLANKLCLPNHMCLTCGRLYSNLSSNQLSGPLPPSYSKLANLKHLLRLPAIPCVFLAYLLNSVLGITPFLLAREIYLPFLFRILSENRFSGTLPAEWSGLTALQTL